ncbi:zinc-binding dehydrogenase [Sorangium cellulosum]|uniref:zinc-binding dehydrogenase n=1 Tax=Sorangium cellulosum TaxID=56 RepID=UPI0009D76FFF
MTQSGIRSRAPRVWRGTQWRWVGVRSWAFLRRARWARWTRPGRRACSTRAGVSRKERARDDRDVSAALPRGAHVPGWRRGLRGRRGRGGRPGERRQRAVGRPRRPARGCSRRSRAGRASWMTAVGEGAEPRGRTGARSRGGEIYDIIFDTVAKSSFSRCKGSLAKNGVYLSTVFTAPLLLQRSWTSMVGGKRATSAMSIEKTEGLNFIRGLIEVGRLRPVIDRRYPLEQTAEVHRYVDEGHKKGSIVITVTLDVSSGRGR